MLTLSSRVVFFFLRMRRTIASRLTASKREVPHYQLSVDVELDALLEARARLNDGGEEGAVARLGVNDFLVKAAALALMRVPEVNSSWGDDAVRRPSEVVNLSVYTTSHFTESSFVFRCGKLICPRCPSPYVCICPPGYHYADVAVAVAVPDGLVTPVVRDADTKGVGAIAADVRSLVSRARGGGLSPSDYEGGTFTISNLGMRVLLFVVVVVVVVVVCLLRIFWHIFGPSSYLSLSSSFFLLSFVGVLFGSRFGVRAFNAIINPPQAAILAVGAAERRVLANSATADGGDPYRVATIMSATLSCDHRVVDGAVGAQWLAEFKSLLERPLTMLL